MKYVGSKSQFADQLINAMRPAISRAACFVDSFCGGGNVVCAVSGNRIANDSNVYVVALLEALAAGWKPEKITRKQYHAIKNSKSMFPKHLVGWAGICCSYSGKWFAGFADKVTTKIGTVRDYQEEAIKNVERQRAGLVGVKFSSVDYEELTIPKNSVVYCDIPYSGTLKYDGNEFNYNRFWSWAENQAKINTLFVSEYSAPDGWTCVWERATRSSLSANGKCGGSKESIEKLFVLQESRE